MRFETQICPLLLWMGQCVKFSECENFWCEIFEKTGSYFLLIFAFMRLFSLALMSAVIYGECERGGR
jgi:hypothetical protein